MKISSISDVHIKHSGDNAYLLLEKFFSNELTLNSDIIVLNGDIFDILIGGKPQYLKKYESFFRLIKSATELGTTVVYIEGNHDFHTKKIIDLSLKKFSIQEKLFLHVKNTYSVETSNQKVVFTHGDDVEIDNEVYKNFKLKVNNPLVKFLSDHILPFSLIEWAGHKASNKSRKSNEIKYELCEKGQAYVKEKFRKSADLFFQSNNEVSLLVCGHSHCKDLYINDKKTYINNGFAPRSQSFIYITENGAEFIDL